MDNVVLLNVFVSLISRHVLHASALILGPSKRSALEVWPR